MPSAGAVIQRQLPLRQEATTAFTLSLPDGLGACLASLQSPPGMVKTPTLLNAVAPEMTSADYSQCWLDGEHPRTRKGRMQREW